MLHVKVKLFASAERVELEDEVHAVEQPQRTLMDMARAQCYFPKLDNPEKRDTFKKFVHGTDDMRTDLFPAIFMKQNGAGTLNGKSVMHDLIILKFQSVISGVQNQHLEDFKLLIGSVRELLWYMAPHKGKFSARNCPIPTFFQFLCPLNDPKRHKHTTGNLDSNKLMLLLGGITCQLEKSYINRNSLSEIKESIDLLAESAVKYLDYLAANCDTVADGQSNEDEPTYRSAIFELPCLEEVGKYKIERERKSVEEITLLLNKKDFYDPVNIDSCFPHSRSFRYRFVKNLKQSGLPGKNISLFAQYYGGIKGNVYFVWREDPSVPENHAIARNQTIDLVQRSLPKYFSRGHKNKARIMIERLMFDKITPAEFRVLYSELTGDDSASTNCATQEIDDRMQTIMNNLSPDLAKDLRVNNARKSKFDQFWDICTTLIESLTAVDERRHAHGSTSTGDVIVNMAVAISARDLYNQCKTEALKTLQEEEIPSLSWFRFQFWPKDTRTHTALNYTGRFKVRYMMQQRMLRKHHDDGHYCACINKYIRSMAVKFRDVSTLLCTDDKHKISIGEPGYPLSALPRGRRVLVAQNQSYQVGDHDFSLISLTPTVILLHDIPDEVEGSWYRGKPHVLLKVTASCPSTALRNAREIANMLVSYYGSKEDVPPVLFLYTDGGPEHRTNFLSVKIAMIALKKFFNLDLLIAARTAPGHSYRNPAEKINCILNLGLYGVGCMRHKVLSDPEFEVALSRCSDLKSVRSLLAKAPDKNVELLNESCDPCLDLIKQTFSRLSLKDNQFEVDEPATSLEVDEMFQGADLDESLQPRDTMANIKNRPKLSQFLRHCCRERTYFFSIKKCGNKECEVCLPPRLSEDDFSKLNHLPDPTPCDDQHYKAFEEVYGTETNETHMPSLKTVKNRKHNIPFNPLQQHAVNTRLTLECAECDKPRIVYAMKKLTTKEINDFKYVMSNLLYTCGTELVEYKEQINTAKQYILEKVYVRANHTCLTAVETIYYSCKIHPDCCTWCGSTRRLNKAPNTFPICSPCQVKKTPVVKKRSHKEIN